MLDLRTAQTTLENALRDAVLLAFGIRLPEVATVAALRAVVTQGASGSARSDDDLINVVVAGVVTAAYRWSAVSTAADDGAAVVKPTDVAANGRWLRWTSPLRAVPLGTTTSRYLHEVRTGFLERVILLDREFADAEMTNLIAGAAPAVLIDARGDSPDDMGQATGFRWAVDYDFSIYCVSENLRPRREAAQGSLVPSDTYDPGANAVDGAIWALLGGAALYGVVDGVRNVQVGHADNWVSALAQRRVIRRREYTVQATVENPPASNDAGAVTELDVMPDLVDLHGAPSADLSDYVSGGLGVVLGTGLSRTVSAGTAVVGGTAVSYAGELHTFDADSDTYRDLLPSGAMVFTAVASGHPAPPPVAGALRVGFTRTDGSGATDDVFLAITRVPDWPST